MKFKYKVDNNTIYKRLKERFNCLVLRDYDPEQGNIEDLLEQEEDKTRAIIFTTTSINKINRRDCYIYGTKTFYIIQRSQKETIIDFAMNVVECLENLKVDIYSVNFGRVETLGGVSLESAEIRAEELIMRE